MNYKTFLTCNKYIHFTKAKVRSILTGNAEEIKNTVLVLGIAPFCDINHGTLDAADAFFNAASCRVTQAPRRSKHVIASLKTRAALCMSPLREPPLNATLIFIAPQSGSSASRLFRNQMFVCVCVCMCVPLCYSLAGVSQTHWVEAVSSFSCL